MKWKKYSIKARERKYVKVYGYGFISLNEDIAKSHCKYGRSTEAFNITKTASQRNSKATGNSICNKIAT